MNHSRNQLMFSIDSLQKLDHGVLLVSCNDPDIAAEVIYALIEQAAASENKTGISFPQVVNIRHFIPGASSQVRYHAARQRMARPSPKGVKLDTIPCGSNSTFDFLGNEGRLAILPHIYQDNVSQSPHLNIFMQQIDSDADVQLAEAVSKYRMAAQKSNGYVVMVLHGHKGFHAQGFEDVADEFCVVNSCEADPECDASFSLDFHGLRHLNRYGVGKVMCSTSVNGDKVEFKYGKFISADVENRAIWFLRAAGESYAEIGKQLGSLNKATIMRRLRQMPVVIPQPLEPDFLARLMENIAVEKQEAQVLTKYQDDDDDDELDDNDDN